MHDVLHAIAWLGWAFLCALGIRMGFTWLFRAKLGQAAQFAAYGMWLPLLVAGFVIVDTSGFQMYGFNAADRAQVFGAWILFYSPLGLPTACGAPAVLVFDTLRAARNRWARRRPA